MKNRHYIKDFLKEKVIKTQYEWDSHLDNIFLIFNKVLCEFNSTNLLDVGCGKGQRTIRIAEHFNIQKSNVLGIDNNDNEIQKCKIFFDLEKVNLENKTIPFNDCNFDLVVCNQVLEQIKNYKHVIDEIIRVTNKKKYILLGILNLAHLINRIYLLFGIQPLCIRADSSHVRGFTHKAFLEILKSIENIKLKGSTGSCMYPLPYVMDKFLSSRFTGFAGYTCYLLEKT
jgi:ubiquinone/menaquinone biosynthesis C-methylase UbiE